MPGNFSDNIVYFMLLLGVALAGVWYLFDRLEKSKNGSAPHDPNRKGFEVLHQAVKDSQTMLSQAELNSSKMVTDTKFSTHKLEQELASQLQALTQHYQTVLTQSVAETQKKINETEQQFVKSIDELRNRSEQFEKSHQLVSEERMDELLEKLQTKLWDFLVSVEQKSMTSIDLELRSSRQLIETYKREQLRLIDENIVAILERTLSHVLSKKLSLKDQLDLVYEGLEKAKVEKFVA